MPFLDNVFDGARAFFSRVYEYCVKWLPLEDPLLKHCQFVDFEKRRNSSFDCVLRTIEHFSTIHAKLIEQPELLDTLEEEFLEYQALMNDDITQSIWNETLIQDTSQTEHHRMDMVWGNLRQRFPLLSEVALSILVIPHSNDADERVFSIIRKNKTEFRSRLELGNSLNSIILPILKYFRLECLVMSRQDSNSQIIF